MKLSDRSFLILQGVNAPFFSKLADALAAQGAAVSKVNFTAGDCLYWGRRPAYAFRGWPEELPAFLAELHARNGFTDQLLFGDCRPLHRQAIEEGTRQGIRTFVFEEGYRRPHWITMELDGVNGHSRLPRSADWYRYAARRWQACSHVPFSAPLWRRAAYDIAYHLAGMANPWRFPHYRTHAPIGPVPEYLGYVARFPRVAARRERDARAITRLLASRRPFWLVPLQLDTDAQVRVHSPFRDMMHFVSVVLESFGRSGPSDGLLLFKNHPLDTGIVDFEGAIRAMSRAAGLQHAVMYLENADLGALISAARGVVTVNSTSGLASLAAGVRTLVLGRSIYDLPGLTFQGEIDEFWCDTDGPDPQLFGDFLSVLTRLTQVNGGFYGGLGMALAVRNSAAVLADPVSPGESG